MKGANSSTLNFAQPWLLVFLKWKALTACVKKNISEDSEDTEESHCSQSLFQDNSKKHTITMQLNPTETVATSLQASLGISSGQCKSQQSWISQTGRSCKAAATSQPSLTGDTALNGNLCQGANRLFHLDNKIPSCLQPCVIPSYRCDPFFQRNLCGYRWSVLRIFYLAMSVSRVPIITRSRRCNSL